MHGSAHRSSRRLARSRVEARLRGRTSPREPTSEFPHRRRRGCASAPREALLEEDDELGASTRPVTRTAAPCLLRVADGEIDELERSVVGGERTADLQRLAELEVQGLDGVGGVDDAAYFEGKVEERGPLVEAVAPGADRVREALAPGGVKRSESRFGGLHGPCRVIQARMLAQTALRSFWGT